MVNNDLLLPSYLFSDEFRDFEEIILETSQDHVTYQKGEIISMPGDDRNYCYYVIEGVAIFYLIHSSGRHKATSFRGEGTIFPLYYDYSQTLMEKYLEIQAFTDLKLIRLTRKQMYSLMFKYSAFAIAMSNCYCRYTTLLLYDLGIQMFSDVLIKTANFLYIYLIYMDKEKTREIRMSQEEIGATIGVTRSNVTRALSRLKQDGIIQISRGKIKVLSRRKLLKYCTDFSPYVDEPQA